MKEAADIETSRGEAYEHGMTDLLRVGSFFLRFLLTRERNHSRQPRTFITVL